MNRKLFRITLLIPIIAILFFLGVGVTLKLNSSTFQTSNLNFISEEVGIQIPGDYLIYEILGTESCSCLGNTYSDDLPPEIVVISPPNNSLILTDTIIYIEASDNFPAGMVGGVNFVPEYVYYHWNNATSNITAYDAGVDGEPPDDDGIVRIEILLPNDDAGATHILYFYAVDYENNWTSFILVYTTAGEETTTTNTTTITTTTTTTTITTSTTTTSSTTISTSTEVTTEESSDTTTESIPTLNITTGFSAHVFLFLLMIVLSIKKGRRNLNN